MMSGRFALTTAVAAAAGFIALSYEILWFRAFSFVSWGHPTVFGLLLAFYLLGIAVGSAASRRFCDDGATGPARDEARDHARLRALGAFVLLADVVGFAVVPLLARLAGGWWVASFGLVAIAAALLGAVLPLVAHHGIAADDRAGAKLSYVYVANIVGSASGSFLTGFVLMDAMSTRGISLLLAWVGLAMAALLFVAARARTAAAVASVACAAAFAASGPLFHRLYERLYLKEKYDPAFAFVDVLENRHGVIAVNSFKQVYGGGAYDGAFNVSLVDDKNVIERAFALAALHPAPHEVLMIGLSSGSWAQVIAHLPGVEHLTVVEINPGYVTLIRRYDAVKSLLDDPHVAIHVDDGRRWLLRHPDARFDAIVMNTTYHWRAHTTNLLSREFLELARAHLRPGGIHYFNTTSSEDAQRTAAEAFPYALRVVNFMAVSDAPLAFDRARWERVLHEVVIDGLPALDFGDPHQRDVYARLMDLADSAARADGRTYELHALEGRDSVLARTRGASVITDDNMACEWRHPLDFPKGPD